MLIYVINILNDSFNLMGKIASNVNRGKVTLNDAYHITTFAKTNKNLCISEVNKNLINIFEIIKKHKVSTSNSLELFEIIFGNEYNDWIASRMYLNDYDKYEEKLILPHIVNDILKKDTDGVLNNLSSMSDNVKKIILKTMFIPISESEKEINKYKIREVC